MGPITKIWHFKLKDISNLNNSEFLNLWKEILELCSSYTNPESGSAPKHLVYRSIQTPEDMVMITGYPSQELNNECDKIYAEKYLPKMFEFVTHIWLRQLAVDVARLPIDANRIVVWCGGHQPKEVGGSGGWDVWQATKQAETNENDAQGIRKGEGLEVKVWVQVSAADNENHLSRSEDAQEVFLLQKFLSR